MKDTPSKTAELVCFMRAADAREPADRRIVDDPHAHHFLGPVARAALSASKVGTSMQRWAGPLSTGVTTFVLARHRFIDEALEAALAEGGTKQVVLLGAGYDTRGLRIEPQLRDVRFFEVDHPATAERKRHIIESTEALREADASNARVTRVRVDFRTDDLDARLLDAGFDRSLRTFFVWEGVSMYLSRRAVEATLAVLRGLSATGSELAMDYWFLVDDPDLYSTVHRVGTHFLQFLGEPIVFSLHPEDAPDFLERNGWNVQEVSRAAELEERFVRDGRRVSPANYVLRALVSEAPTT